MNDMWDLIIAGSGAAGMVSAIKAAEKHLKVLILEKGNRSGRKILASGNGRCNLMNTGSPRYYGDPDFALKVLRQTPRLEITAFLRKYGLLTTEEDDRIYPLSFHSSSVVSVFQSAMKATSVSVCLNCPVSCADKQDSVFKIHTATGEVFLSQKFLVACGGSAQPKLGGCNDGYHILRSFGHSVTPLFPSLVPLVTDKKSISGLSGIRARCKVILYEKKTVLHSEAGEILFTDYGVSGICIMQCARFVSGRQCYLKIDFFQNCFDEKKDIINEFRRRQLLYSSFSPLILMEGIVQDRIAFAILKQAGIDLVNTKAGDLKESDLIGILQTATGYRIDILGNRGFEYAQVTAGGINCREFNPLTMESYIIPGLYAAGEVLNVDGDCGGFNIMFALSSGLTAAKAI